MNSYINSHKEKLERSKIIENRFKQFCIGLYETQTISIEPQEKEEFEKLRAKEHDDYIFRKKVFWPAWALGLLFFDQLYTMPSSRGNKIRIFTNIVLGIPFVSIAITGLIFYRENIESHEYAITLCDKYKVCNEEVHEEA